jgi:predicted nuclease of predicted toxin-antitoxin system
VRFLVDRCAGAKLARWLRAAGHDVADSGEWSVDPGDAELLRRAAAEDRILITIDHDFGQILFTGGAAHRGLIRLPDCTAEERIRIVADLLERHLADLEARTVITVRNGRVRISQTPPL